MVDRIANMINSWLEIKTLMEWKTFIEFFFATLLGSFIQFLFSVWKFSVPLNV